MKASSFQKVIGICCLTGLFLIGFCPALLRAAEYPTKTITIVVPMVAGGQFDLGARVLADAMEKQLKQPVVVANRPGAAGTIGGYSVASAKPDGYTLGYFHNTPAAPEVYSFFYGAPYTSNDLIAICRAHQLLNVITVKEDAPYNTLKEFIEYARKNPGVKCGHNGKGSLQYLTMSSIAKTEKITLGDVPFDGDGAILPALLGGHIPLGVPAFSVIKSQVKAKKLKMLATCSEKRTSFTPDVPALGELGYKIPYIISMGFFAPKKTPDAVIKKISEVTAKIVEDKEFQKKNVEMDMIVAFQNGADFKKEIDVFKENVTAIFVEQGLVKK